MLDLMYFTVLHPLTLIVLVSFYGPLKDCDIVAELDMRLHNNAGEQGATHQSKVFGSVVIYNLLAEHMLW